MDTVFAPFLATSFLLFIFNRINFKTRLFFLDKFLKFPLFAYLKFRQLSTQPSDLIIDVRSWRSPGVSVVVNLRAAIHYFVVQKLTLKLFVVVRRSAGIRLARRVVHRYRVLKKFDCYWYKLNKQCGNKLGFVY